jgi:cytochrome c-type biogenesis protein CcmH
MREGGAVSSPSCVTLPQRKGRVALLSIAVLTAAVLLSAFFWRDNSAPVANEAEAAAVTTVGLLPELAAHLEKYPRDARAWAIFARLKFARGDYADAGAAYAHAVELPGKVARDPLVWCEYADALAMAGDGRLAGKPRELIDRALALNRSHPRALEMAGSAEIEAGNFAAALRYWEELLLILPADSPARDELARAVERTRMRAGR